MRSKAPLALIEQAIMLLVFALAAALCLKAFVWADRQSEAAGARDKALLQAQNAAETLKACHGDFEKAASVYGGTWDGTVWMISQNGSEIQVSPRESGQKYLGAAVVEVTNGGETLAQLPVNWQEVDENA